MHKKLVNGEFRCSGAMPSRPSGLNWVQSQRKNRALTPISLVYCGKSVASFNRRLFSAELEGLREGSERCLSVWRGNTGPSQRRGLSRSLSTDLEQLVNLSEVYTQQTFSLLSAFPFRKKHAKKTPKNPSFCFKKKR